MPRRKKIDVPDGMPVVIEAQGSERERLSLWFKERIDLIERESQARIEILRTVGEHPSPIFARFVKQYGGLGLSRTLTAKLLGLSPRMLEENYGDDYDLGAAEIISSVAANMIRIGTSTSDPAAAKVGMDILSRRGGQEWRPPSQKIEMDDNRDAPPIIDSSKLTFEERAQLRAMLTRVDSGGEGEPVQPGEDEGVLIE